MFRFVALSWDPRAPAPSGLAATLAEPLKAPGAWSPVLSRPGLEVFIAGAQGEINRAYPLGDGRGVVLGKLFRRDGAAVRRQETLAGAIATGRVPAAFGKRLVEEYWGRYVAILDDGDRGIQVLRDPSGTLPCLRMQHGGVDVVFSWLEDVLDLMAGLSVPAVSEEGLRAHIVLGEITGRQTALQGVTQVLPGESVRLGHAGPGDIVWDAAEIARRPLRLAIEEARTALHDRIRMCTASWASSYAAVLLRLSGGVDSSILLSCLAAGRTDTAVTCLNYHSPGVDSDERQYARLAASRARRELVELERDASFRLERTLTVARTPAPINHIGRMTGRMDAEMAALLGAPAMFTGGGGDQMLYEFQQWWPAADYLRLRGVDAGFLSAAMDASRLGRISVWRTLSRAIADRFRRRPPASVTNRLGTLGTQEPRSWTADSAKFLHPASLASTDLPIGKLMQVLQLTHSGGYYDPYERDAAPELVNPLLSQPLVELCLRLPTFQLAHGGQGRALAREAFAADVPAEIVNRRSKGGMEEHISAVLMSNLVFARELLLDGEMVRRGLIERHATEDALSMRDGLKSRSIAELHLCIGVEAWLRLWASWPARRPE